MPLHISFHAYSSELLNYGFPLVLFVTSSYVVSRSFFIPPNPNNGLLLSFLIGGLSLLVLMLACFIVQASGFCLYLSFSSSFGTRFRQVHFLKVPFSWHLLLCLVPHQKAKAITFHLQDEVPFEFARVCFHFAPPYYIRVTHHSIIHLLLDSLQNFKKTAKPSCILHRSFPCSTPLSLCFSLSISHLHSTRKRLARTLQSAIPLGYMASLRFIHHTAQGFFTVLWGKIISLVP